jgi:NAD(P)-dependent dehydrogenase (short-subunit alcohol dehydrogenase family)
MSPEEGSENFDPRALFSLDGKVAVVVGGSRGMGRSISLGLAAAGAEVVVASRKIDACQAVAGEIAAKYGIAATALSCHIGRWSELDGFVETILSRHRKIDVLVNNAGMSPLYESVADISESLYDKTMDVNLKGPFRLTAIVGTHMQQNSGGSIVNVGSSGASMHPRPHLLPYAAAKTGLLAATAGFAHAFGPSVRVNCVLPGPFATEVSQSWTEGHLASRLQQFALGRAGAPGEIVGAVLYLASAASSFTSGAFLRVDGGEM